MIGPAEAVLSTVGAKASAWSQAQARKSRATERMFDATSDLAARIGEFPALLRKGKEEREEKEVNDAALAGYMQNGLEGMRDAALSVPTTTPGGSRARLGALMRHSAMTDAALATAARRRQMEHEDAAAKATAAYFSNKPMPDMGRTSLVPGVAMRAAGVPAPEGLRLPMMGRAPTTDERLERMGQTPGVRFSDLSVPFMDAQRRDLAREADRTKAERQQAELDAKAAEKEKDRVIRRTADMERARHNLASEGIQLAAEGGRNSRAQSERELAKQLAQMKDARAETEGVRRERISGNADAIRLYAVDMSEFVAKENRNSREGIANLAAVKERIASVDRVLVKAEDARRKDLAIDKDVSAYDESIGLLRGVRDALHKQMQRGVQTTSSGGKPKRSELIKAEAAPRDLTPAEQAQYDALNDAGKKAFMEALK